jgi:3-oxoacyl-[acyl-carrier protein] reductase
VLTDSGLAGKTVLVTGGSRGIGRAIVELFSAEGADVTFLFRENTAAAAEVVAAGHAAGRQITAEQVDVRHPQGCAEVVERVAVRCGHIDVLINNATRAVVPHMIARRAGKIINISSVAGEKGGRGQTNYAASKGAVNAFTRALAVELAPRRITVNTVAPGVIETEMSQAIRDHAGEQVTSRILLRRFGTPTEVAYAVWFLASRFADYITGEVLHVDGGFKME